MKSISILLLLFISGVPTLFGQFYHNRNIKLANGDTINRMNQLNLYEGYHIIADNQNYSTSDSNHYYAGIFNNGVPSGIWLDHNKDGSFSKGEYEVAHETFYDDSSKSYSTLIRGIGNKKGVWSFYSKDSVLTNKIRYQVTKTAKSTVWEEFLETDSTGYKLIYFRKHKENKWNHKFSKLIEKKYYPTGNLQFRKKENFLRFKTIEYRPNGTLKTVSKYSPIIDRDVEIKYNRKGIKNNKTVYRSFKRGIEGCPKFR